VNSFRRALLIAPLTSRYGLLVRIGNNYSKLSLWSTLTRIALISPSNVARAGHLVINITSLPVTIWTKIGAKDEEAQQYLSSRLCMVFYFAEVTDTTDINFFFLLHSCLLF